MKRFIKSLLLKIPFVEELRLQRDEFNNKSSLLKNDNEVLVERMTSLQKEKDETTEKLNKANDHINKLNAELNSGKTSNNTFPLFVENGHYYSPIPSIEDVKSISKVKPDSEIHGVNLNTKAQLKLVDQFKEYYNQLPFKDEKVDKLRYYFKNHSYSYSDAIFLYCMMYPLKLKKYELKKNEERHKHLVYLQQNFFVL